MHHFDETLSLIHDMNLARNSQEVCEKLLAITRQFGLDRLIAGTQPDPRASAKTQKQHAILHGWPDGWMERYATNKYVKIDPIVQHLKNSLNPYQWQDASVDLQRDHPGRLVLNEATEFGLRAGLAIPLVTMDGTLALVSLGGEKPEIPPLAIGMISLVSTYAIARALQISATQAIAAESSLTKRETECIRWAAEGKSEWEISMILGISEHTSEKHLLNAKMKLGAVNRTQAVAEAIRRGYIT